MKKTIGIDIGGSKITGIVFNGKKAIKELTIVTPKNLFEFERNLLKLVDFLSAKEKISSVGVGMAGLVNSEKGIVKYSPNIKFIKNLDLVKFFKVNGIKTAKVDNDANCFARAEMVLGQGKSFNNFLAITLGTGIGGGIIIGKKIYRGAQNNGAEFGHMVMGNIFFEKTFQKYRDNRDFISAGKLVGEGFASLVNVLSPEAIIVGGGFGHNEAPKYLPTAKIEMLKYLFDPSVKLQILITKLKNAGAIGAALMVK